jgi:hypothetical protein
VRDRTRPTAEARPPPADDDPPVDASARANLSASLLCDACGLEDDGERGWRVYLADAGPWQLETLCPVCAECERGEDERQS